MTVSEFRTQDPDVIQYFLEVPTADRSARFETCVKVGTIALKTIGTAERVDYVEKRFNLLRDDFERKLDEAFGENGAVQRTVEEYFGDKGLVPETIDDFLGEKGKLAEMLEEHFGPDGKVVKEMFDPSTPGTPLAKLKNEFERQLVELRKDLGLAEQAGAIAEVTPIKGRKFEDAFDEILGELARPHGDIVERTTEKPGLLKGSKKGDFVVTLGERIDIKLVFETKDTGTVSLPTIQESMKESLENRGAAYGIFVAKSLGTLPKSVGWFNEYWGNVLVLALGEGEDTELEGEIARVAYKWARMRALAAKAALAEGVDATAIQQGIDEARRTMKKFTQIRTQCTNAKQAVDAILQELETIQSSLEASLDAIGAEVLKAIP